MAYLELENLETYKLAKKLGEISWDIFRLFNYDEKRIFGFQFVEASDSVGANIAEGYGRYHYLDKIKFYYNARGSLLESKHWIDVIIKRKPLISKEIINNYLKTYQKIPLAINGLIKVTMKQKEVEKGQDNKVAGN